MLRIVHPHLEQLDALRQPLHNGPGQVVKDGALGGYLYGPLYPVEQHYAELALDLLQVGTDRRLADLQVLGGPGNAA